jgi:hypothetical protein
MMRCPSLSELPPPPPGKTGWPWTEESARLYEPSRDGHSCSRFTVVTPSYNQGKFIEETIRSVLLQGYPDLEYFVLDGGSNDNSVEIIKKYSPWITFWASEPDSGQSAAINRGFKMGSGFYSTWINSDDLLCKNALVAMAPHFSNKALRSDLVLVGDCLYAGESLNILFTHRGRVHTFEELVRVSSIWHTGGCIDQPATIFPLELFLRAGGLNEENRYTMDYELWGEFFLAGAKLQYTEIPFGIFRSHQDQKTQDNLKQTNSMLDAAENLVKRATILSTEVRQEMLDELQAYRAAYAEILWKQSGRLARIGIPRPVVTSIRNWRDSLRKTIGGGLVKTK